MMTTRTKSLAVSLLSLTVLATSFVASAQDTDAAASSGSGTQTRAPAPSSGEEPSYLEMLLRLFESSTEEGPPKGVDPSQMEQGTGFFIRPWDPPTGG
jgi:hypothetical protein